MHALPDLPPFAWITLILVALGVAAAMLRVMGSAALTATESHDLCVQVHRLHLEYKRRLLELNGAEGTKEDPIDGVPVESLESDDVMLV